MSRTDAVVLTSRALALLLMLWALIDLSYIPEEVISYRRYIGHEVTPTNSEYWFYWSHHYLLNLSFLIARIIGLSLLSRWLFKGGPEVFELLLPAAAQENSTTEHSL